MDKEKLLTAVSNVRKSISQGIRTNYPTGTADIHAALDEVIATVGEPDKVLEISERSLEEQIIALLLLRKKQKERSVLAEKAKKAIAQLED